MSVKKSIYFDEDSEFTIKSFNFKNVAWSATVNNIITRYNYFLTSCYPYHLLKSWEQEAINQLLKKSIDFANAAIEVNKLSWIISDAIKYDNDFCGQLKIKNRDPLEFLKKIESMPDYNKLAVIDQAKYYWYSNKNSVVDIKAYPTNLILKTNKGETMNIDIEGKAGLYTKENWQEDETILGLDDDSQEQVFKIMEKSSDNGFFKINTENRYD